MGSTGPPGKTGPSHHLGQGTDRGECCGNVAGAPGMGMCMGPWQPPLESPFVPLGLTLKGDISYLCKISQPKL